uniref:NTF2-related export protein n=1 Tax=Hemiselmis andersenii TaxID=464988 RepID=A0A6U4VY36_HEMAN|mmetsp:Transcript_22936/g.52691  ORF Transcript_22936/g.52691 Transcript_22936/m.52691 type:complete len:137 (+) Transcript_22936:164-574(+)
MTDTVSITTEGGEQFQKHFYEYLDSDRKNLQHLYHEESKVVWNGQPLKGKDAVTRFLAELPTSKHEVQSLDCQPVATGGDGSDPMILVTVMGVVLFGDKLAKPAPETKPFAQTFVLGKDPVNNAYFICADNYRFTT